MIQEANTFYRKATAAAAATTPPIIEPRPITCPAAFVCVADAPDADAEAEPLLLPFAVGAGEPIALPLPVTAGVEAAGVAPGVPAPVGVAAAAAPAVTTTGMYAEAISAPVRTPTLVEPLIVSVQSARVVPSREQWMVPYLFFVFGIKLVIYDNRDTER
jgi:hypothetical protein